MPALESYIRRKDIERREEDTDSDETPDAMTVETESGEAAKSQSDGTPDTTAVGQIELSLQKLSTPELLESLLTLPMYLIDTTRSLRFANDPTAFKNLSQKGSET